MGGGGRKGGEGEGQRAGEGERRRGGEEERERGGEEERGRGGEENRKGERDGRREVIWGGVGELPQSRQLLNFDQLFI